MLIEDPAATTLAHPTNVAFKGDKLYTANLGRWHITEIDLAAIPNATNQSLARAAPCQYHRTDGDFLVGSNFGCGAQSTPNRAGKAISSGCSSSWRQLVHG